MVLPLVAPRPVCTVPMSRAALAPVYAMERQLARTHRGDNLIFHKACFRCEDCGTLLRPDSWEVHGDAAALDAGRGALL
ncbi:hypothetical protein EMIHUDRAFT_246971 [Emiliania huxleyi CCMP1516]|uniref:LIM zinc-binding domain-containing protein n=2 Tax=Emiliania huxleyi TaxID=2903 RepID=A0A0D3I1R2_EMIH1|nr:hypothetical protein EMIHUDRAFT_220336 [Emiliania huxleyi CCMP1516]XP_005765751.1 hypothetical protein EMIHUDRAFT_246971 [Emiliania huxleyi CCMP1516]EOD05197.1 hypothetical protein EMIHUDRAFT_220336 [Emiliania huxleyi CCMP1516]EOD13322.1 hypothetical protein EMIHUDRAFT_246971 [Emiliania huxleyi CCMP1516]|eukprot:XP_005757626.1 hypothetical protein EMIHUDRAFT_220336 [Emiliania huxleyi CCMP1516]